MSPPSCVCVPSQQIVWVQGKLRTESPTMRGDLTRPVPLENAIAKRVEFVNIVRQLDHRQLKLVPDTRLMTNSCNVRCTDLYQLVRGRLDSVDVPMRPRTTELLYVMLWTFETLSRPSFRNIRESFEGWAYRRGFLERLQELEALRFIERRDVGLQRVFRLTESGRLHALGGSDPESRWNRPWDGRWRLVVFDVPNEHTRLRNQFRDQLRKAGYGWLQNSVWISPDRLPLDRSLLRLTKADVESLLLLEAIPIAGESNSDIVRGAWNFSLINELYENHGKVLDQRPSMAHWEATDAERLIQWGKQEQASWESVLERDPLLPRALLPSDYPGMEAWSRRQKVMGEIGERLRQFRPKT